MQRVCAGGNRAASQTLSSRVSMRLPLLPLLPPHGVRAGHSSCPSCRRPAALARPPLLPGLWRDV